MNRKKKILVIGRNQSIMNKILSLLEMEGYMAKGVFSNSDAIQSFDEEMFDAVVIGGGVDDESRSLFHTTFLAKKPSIKILDAHPNTLISHLKTALD